MVIVCEMLYISLQCIIVWVYNIWWGHIKVKVVLICRIEQSYPCFNVLVGVYVSLSAWSTTGTVTVIASYQHQNIHKLRHNGHNTTWILKCVWGVGVGVGGALQYPFKPISDIFYGLEVSVERGGALCALFTDHSLFTMKPAPTLKRCGPKMFYLLSGLASIKLMESIQLSSFPFPFRPGHRGEYIKKILEPKMVHHGISLCQSFFLTDLVIFLSPH